MLTYAYTVCLPKRRKFELSGRAPLRNAPLKNNTSYGKNRIWATAIANLRGETFFPLYIAIDIFVISCNNVLKT